MAFESPIIKTKIGQHDFHKPACVEYCKLGSQYCPFMNLDDRLKRLNIIRWTDAMDERFETRVSGKESNVKSYNVFFDFEKTDDLSNNEKQLEVQKKQSRHCCWGDGSGFEYDIMSSNLIGPGGPVQSIYDITDYGVKHQVLKHGDWNAWIDKFQYDYRFGRVSDTNAETILFPNVDNPWMFTEYVFKGVKDSGVCALDLPQEYIVQPPIYDPQTLQLINGDLQLQLESKFDNKYKQFLKRLKNKKDVKQFRQIISWSQLAKFSEIDVQDNPELLKELNSQVKEKICKDYGMKLYRAKIPVQSIKWGEHGNIPPHTLDMTAPKDWFDAQARGKVKAIYDAYIGSPFYCTQTGVIKWEKSEQAAYNKNVNLKEQFNNSKKKYYLYEYGNDFVQLSMPIDNTTGILLTPSAVIMGGFDQDNYCHFGCSLCKGNSDNKLKCMYLEGLNDDSDEISIMNDYFDQKCLKYNYGINPASNQKSQYIKCPHFIQSQNKRIIATYQAQVTNIYQSNLAGNVLTGDLEDLKDYIINLGKREDLTVTYVVRYEIQRSSKNQAKLNKEPNSRDQFGRGIMILPETGKYAIDSSENANPFSGGDSNVYNDISVLSFHRFFLSAMHCSSQKYCNQFVGPSQNIGYVPGIKAEGQGKCRYYNYEQEQGSTIGCPHNCPPKRAIQFCNVKKDVKKYIDSYMNLYQNLSNYGIWQLDASTQKDEEGNENKTGYFYETLELYKKEKITTEDNQIEWIVFNDWAVARKKTELSKKQQKDEQIVEKIAVIAVKTSVGKDEENLNDDKLNQNSSVYYGGAVLLYDECCPKGFKIFCQLRTEERKKTINVTPWWYDSSSSSQSEKYPCQIEITVIKCIQGYYWYQPLTNDGNILSGFQYFDSSFLGKEDFKISCIENRPKHLHQHVDKNGYWFCKLENVNPVPTTNCVMIDNEQKFIGGWHPEYKDYSKIGSQFLQEIISDESRQGQGIGDYVINGDYNPIPQNTSTQGYWVDQSGEYIIDERDTGWSAKIAYDQQRQTASGGNCISFKKSNTIINQSTGQTEKAKVINGAVFANDPAFFWMEEYGRPFKGKYNRATKEIEGGHPWFDDPSRDQRYYAPCIVKDVYLLPTMRPAIYCPKCDYYLSYRYHNIKKCPWCDSDYQFIRGSDGSEYWYTGPHEEKVDENGQSISPPDDAASAFGTTWEEKWSENCEKDENGNPTEPFPIIKKFFKLNALGNVDVWAPPGSAIKTDAYFWKRPTEISNAHKKQIYHRLGNIGMDEQSNRFVFLYDKETTGSELTLGFPEGVGKFEKVPYLTYEEMGKGDKRYNAIQWKQTVEGNENKLHVIDGMYNPIMPRHMLPEFYENQSSEQDQGVIAPYSLMPNSNPSNRFAQDALKSVSRAEIIKIRNAVEPTYAYCSAQLDSGDFPTMRASYNLRTLKDQNIIYQNRRALIPPIILAHTFGDHDAYQEYFSGDYTYGNVREYFPNGYTWWNMKQVMGGRHSELKGGIYHMDDGNDPLKGFHSKVHFPVTQKETIAKCAISIYGLLPLDKKILKAYIVITPSGVDPSKDPIGRAWNGGPVMYHHYHAMKQDHFSDGAQAHLHGTAGYPEGTYFDENGEMKHYEVRGTGYMDSQIKLQDESNTNLWGVHGENIEDDRNMYYDDKFIDTMTNISGLYDMSFYRNVGTPKKVILLQNQEQSSSEIVSYHGYDKDSFPNPAGWITVNLSNSKHKMQQIYQYIVLNNKKEIVQKYSDSMIWRDMTKQQIEDVIDRNSSVIQFGASDGSDDSRVSYQFTEMNSKIYEDLIPNQSQGIPGYFNLSWANTRGYVYDNFYVQKNKSVQWDAPVIFQADDIQINGSIYSGSDDNDGQQQGTTARCLDVTDIVKKLYDNRIARKYNGRGGTTLQAIKTWNFFTSEMGTDEKNCKNINKQFFHSNVINGFLLNERFNYPDLQGDLYNIPEIDSYGDKYKLKPCQVYYEISYNFPVLFSPEFSVTAKIEENTQTDQVKIIGYIYNMQFKVTCDENNNSLKKEIQSEELYSSYIKGYEFKNIDAIIQFLKECTGQKLSIKYEKKSDKKLVIISDYQVSFVNLSFLKVPDALFPVSDRVIQVSSFYNEFHPNCLQYQKDNEKGWKFDKYSDQEQSFVMDLLRGPLLIKQQDWRYKQGYIDYSGAYCPVSSCKAHTVGCSVAANMYYKYFSGKISTCPLCGTSLVGAKGVKNESGDGIPTYFYDKKFDENPIITSLVISGWIEENDFNCSYKCFGKNSNRENWRLLSYYDKITNKTVDCLKGEFARCRFVKVTCESNMKMVYHEFQIKIYDDYQIVVKAPPGTDFTQLQEVSFENLPIIIGKSLQGEEVLYESWLAGIKPSNDYSGEQDESSGEQDEYCNDYGYPMKIVSGQVIGSNKDELKLNLSGIYPPKIGDKDAFPAKKLTHVQIFLKKYRGGIKTFKVYGANYKTESGNGDIINKDNIGSQDKFLVMTDVQDEYIKRIDFKDFRYRLTSVPIHIYSVYVGRGGEQIQLKQCDDAKELLWTVEKQQIKYVSNITGTIEKAQIYRIKGGNYFYDVNHGCIIIPKYAKIDSGNLMITKFEQNLKNTPTSTSYLPTHLIMRYVSGNGKSIKIKVQAEQHGPSYMLQKNAIRNIITKLPIPSDYKSCKILDVNNVIRKDVSLPWICYNNIPATLSMEKQSQSNTNMQGYIINYNSGQFRPPSFGGDELNKAIQQKGKNNIDQHFIDFFGTNATKCWGICESQVTLTGPPNQILSGTISVEAPEKSETTIDIGGGQKYKLTEKTGGIKNGFIVVDCHPVQGERVTKCYETPILLIYACDEHEQS